MSRVDYVGRSPNVPSNIFQRPIHSCSTSRDEFEDFLELSPAHGLRAAHFDLIEMLSRENCIAPSRSRILVYDIRKSLVND